MRLWVALALFISLAAGPGCAGKKADKAAEDLSAVFLAAHKQAITFRVLNGRDRPVAGARITVAPLAGEPAGPGPYITNRKGEVTLEFIPQGKKEMPGMRDTFISFTTKLDYKVQAKGHFGGRGRIESKAQARVMASEELKALNQKAEMQPWVEVVVIRAERELWAGQFSGMPPDHKLKIRLKEYYDQINPVAAHLGCKFAWPAFKLDKAVLSLYFDWTGATWAGLAPAPLKAKVTLNSGMPLAMAVAEDLLPLKGVEKVNLVFLSEYKPPDDPHAAPDEVSISITGSADDLIKLAAGDLTVDDFLDRYPAKLSKKP